MDDIQKALEALKAMGIDLPPRMVKTTGKTPRAAQTKPPESYYLNISSKCKLCGATFEDGFEMKDCPQTGSLQSKRAALPLPPGHRREIRSVNKCRFCCSELLRFSKEELVKKLLDRVML